MFQVMFIFILNIIIAENDKVVIFNITYDCGQPQHRDNNGSFDGDTDSEVGAMKGFLAAMLKSPSSSDHCQY